MQFIIISLLLIVNTIILVAILLAIRNMPHKEDIIKEVLDWLTKINTVKPPTEEFAFTDEEEAQIEEENNLKENGEETLTTEDIDEIEFEIEKSKLNENEKNEEI